MDDKANSADYFGTASFAYFDMHGTVNVTVTCPEAIRSARILPSSLGIEPRFQGKNLRVYHCDSARISNVWFGNIRVEEAPRLISLWIGKAVWTRDEERGHIAGVTFKNIRAQSDPLRVELKGFDGAHAVENVVFEDVVVNSKPLVVRDVNTNTFVRNVTIRP